MLGSCVDISWASCRCVRLKRRFGDKSHQGYVFLFASWWVLRGYGGWKGRKQEDTVDNEFGVNVRIRADPNISNHVPPAQAAQEFKVSW